MITATTWTTSSAAILALTGSVLWAAPSGGATGRDLQAPAPASVSTSRYPAQGPNPLDPPGCWDADGTWHPDCWGPGQWAPGQYGPGQWGPGMMGPGQWGPGMMGPGQWGPGMGPGMMGPGPWDY
ncbi:hypothetical protein BayCH28_22515 [Mycolicibacterium sp. CH28]|nr:hypothetical protein [Mycolicibacterium sp. CH28]TGD85217.1 hypothetical protein BayCH28_22515 [Mycolicibacterium sp. CH28]